MPKDVYNLGRTVGMSAWEIYVRQSLLLNPDIEPLTEREWLSESIGAGTSMLLKVNKDSTRGVHKRDFVLPSNSLLCAPNTIVGSLFLGKAETISSTSNWCKAVTDYGTGIDISKVSGTKTGTNVPTQTLDDIPDETQKQMLQYIKIQDAIFLQDGTWTDASGSTPSKKFIPDVTKPATLRIIFQDQVNSDFYLLLTGFVTRAIVKGEVGWDLGSNYDPSQAGAYHPENGDFLGPELYPWSSKVVFTFPGILAWLLINNIQGYDPHVKVNIDEDGLDTGIEISEIKAGKGITIDDESSMSDPAQPITINSPVESLSDYMSVDQSSDGTTKLNVSKPKSGIGIQIQEPSSQGDSYTISSPVSVKAGSEQVLGVEQASDGTTQLSAVFPATKGTGIDNVEKVKNNETGEIEERSQINSIIDTPCEGDNYLYLDVNQTSGNGLVGKNKEASTILKPSKPTVGQGIGFTPPASPGDDYKLSSLMHTEGCGGKYIGVQQDSVSANEFATTLKPSRIHASSGVSITQPTEPGEEIIISSIIQTLGKDTPSSNSAEPKTNSSKYIKVSQYANDTGCGCGNAGCSSNQGRGAGNTATDINGNSTTGATSIATHLTISLLVAGKRVVINQPTEEGGDITIGTNLSFKTGTDPACAGIGITDYVSTGDNTRDGSIYISAPIAVVSKDGSTNTSNKNYIAVTQYSDYLQVDNTLTNEDENHSKYDDRTRGAYKQDLTKLQPSLIVNESGIAISQPNTPGGDIKISSKIGFNSSTHADAKKYIKIDHHNPSDSSQDSIEIKPSHIRVSGQNDAYGDRSSWFSVSQPDNAGEDIVLVPTNLIAGAGIAIDTDTSNKIATISNSLVSGSWKTFKYQDHYSFKFRGTATTTGKWGFYTADRETMEADEEGTDGNKHSRAFNFAKGNGGKGIPADAEQHLVLRYQKPSLDTDGNILAINMRIATSSSQALFYAGDIAQIKTEKEKRNFLFKHSANLSSTSDKWVICIFDFKKITDLPSALKGMKTDALSKLASEIGKGNYTLINTGQGLNIWNVRSEKDTAVGQSWGVNTGIGVTTNNDGDYKFVLYASQIADGYNSQYASPASKREYEALYSAAHFNLQTDFAIVKG